MPAVVQFATDNEKDEFIDIMKKHNPSMKCDVEPSTDKNKYTGVPFKWLVRLIRIT